MRTSVLLIRTPEGIVFSQTLAGPVARFFAVFLDAICVMAATSVVMVAVTLLADAGGVSVRMAGRALSDGLMNQRVKVQNLSSGKIVEGIARSEQVVEIILQ